MRSNLEFRSAELPERLSDGETPSGKALGELLTEQLPRLGFLVDCIKAEDWGWLVQVSNQEYPL